MHDDHLLVEARIWRALQQRIIPAVHGPAVPLAVKAFEVPGEPISYAEAMAAPYQPFGVGDRWSKPWGTTWFQFDGVIPTDWNRESEAIGQRGQPEQFDESGRPVTLSKLGQPAGPGPLPLEVEAIIDLGFSPNSTGFQAEAAVWTPDGPLSSLHPMHRTVRLANAKPGDGVHLVVEAASNPGFAGTLPTPMGSRATAGDRSLYTMRRADLAIYNREVHALEHDITVLRNTMLMLTLEDPRRHKILRALERAIDALDLDDVVATAARARERLAPALAVPARASAHHIVAVGHAHIDSAWLWPLRETVRKCARTFSSAIALMHDYPEYKFVCSQAAQYDWMERFYPHVFEGIKDRVAAGQWQPVGGMWVEADMNLPSGESIARQLIFGQRYFESRFGERCKEVWIPDVFGYPGSLPQIFKAGGCDRFITQKLSWNKQNRIPHNTFNWFGIDGSSVLTHFPPVDTYNATVDPVELSYAQANFADKGWSDWSLMPFGYGNGGGGPTREMLERARRTKSLDGLPTVQIGSTDEFFDNIEREVGAFGAPEWRGELYFEMHRGTFTSQINTKLGNRTCERLLREAELWWTTLTEADPTAGYPHDELDEIWKEVLLQQFHDIIPGSSIAWVYEDTAEVYGRLIPQLEALIARALNALANPTPTIANAATHARDEIVLLDATFAENIVAFDTSAPTANIVGVSGANETAQSAATTQTLRDGRVAVRLKAPGLGLGPATPAVVDVDRCVSVDVVARLMGNDKLALTWNEDGAITSIFDRVADRELLRPGTHGASLMLGVDRPNEYDAWDLEQWARRSNIVLESDAVRATTVEVVEHGPLVGIVKVHRTFGQSAVTQRFILRAGSARLDIEFDIDWHEDEKVLSVEFPLDVHSDHVDCGIQFGSVARPRYPNTSWDAAKFEVCAHRWVDVSEPGFGVAILNDGRYGHAVQGDSIAVTMLRAPNWPDPTADRGFHRTTISVLPHAGDRRDVVGEAEALNTPLRVVRGTNQATLPEPIVVIADRRVEVSAIKRADDRSGDVVARVFERTGAVAAIGHTIGSRLQTTSDDHLRMFQRTNLLEDREPEHAVVTVWRDDALIRLRPFEMVTLRAS